MEKVGWVRYDLERSGFDMTFASCLSSRLNQLTSQGRLLAERLPVPGGSRKLARSVNSDLCQVKAIVRFHLFILSIWRERCINISSCEVRKKWYESSTHLCEVCNPQMANLGMVNSCVFHVRSVSKRLVNSPGRSPKDTFHHTTWSFAGSSSTVSSSWSWCEWHSLG